MNHLKIRGHVRFKDANVLMQVVFPGRFNYALVGIFYMKNLSLKQLGIKLALLTALVLPDLASAQSQFNYNQYGDVLAGFRKTGGAKGLYELVVDLGNVTNLLALTPGTTINITKYSAAQMTNAFTDTGNFANLQWSAFAAFPGGFSSWATPLGTFPKDTLWYTIPSTNVSIQSQAPLRQSYSTQASTKNLIAGVGTGANSISGFLAVSNANNNAFLVREPVSYFANGNGTALSDYIGDNTYSFIIGDFGANGSPLPQTVENTTPSPFTSAQRDDFYQLCPSDVGVDPITGLSGTTSYFVGYFILNPNGSMTFTRASATPAAPAAGSVTSTVTNGFSPLTVVFTNTATGSITNWVWNFGNGTIITNTTGGNVTNTFAAGGSYTVTLIVSGPGGSSTNTVANYIVASSTPTIKTTFSGSNLMINGTNCPAGVQYRILTTTNLALPLASWNPVWTNTFSSNGSFSCTNAMTNVAGYFRLVSP
jgi:PKD repeat protein